MGCAAYNKRICLELEKKNKALKNGDVSILSDSLKNICNRGGLTSSSILEIYFFFFFFGDVSVKIAESASIY